MVQWSNGPMVRWSNFRTKKKKKKKNLLFFSLNFVLSKFERTINLGLYSKERIFSFETNFERTTDKFRKNVIRSKDLSQDFWFPKNTLRSHHLRSLTLQFNFSSLLKVSYNKLGKTYSFMMNHFPLIFSYKVKYRQCVSSFPGILIKYCNQHSGRHLTWSR